jgi:DNA polymerase elongation subunit (family B)
MTQKELLERKKQIKKKMWDIEKILKDKTFVSSVDFASMYPSVIRLLNASIENLVGFLDDDPIAYRKLGLSTTVKNSKVRSKELVKGSIKDSKYTQYVGKNEEKIAMRKDIYEGKYAGAEINDICETPWERYFLAIMGIVDADKENFKFQGKKYTATELQTYLSENDLSLSGSGAIYAKPGKDNSKQGLIPSYLEYLFKERKKVKKIMGSHYRNKILLQKFKNAAISDGLYI